MTSKHEALKAMAKFGGCPRLLKCNSNCPILGCALHTGFDADGKPRNPELFAKWLAREILSEENELKDK